MGGKRRSAIWLLIVLSLILVACNDNRSVPQNPTRGPLPTLGSLPLRQAGPAITAGNAPKLQALANLSGHSVTVNQIVFSPDSERIATLDADGEVIVWDAEHFRRLPPPLYQGGFQRVFFSADSSSLYALTAPTLNGGGELVAFIPDTGGKIGSVSVSRERLTAHANSPDSRYLAAADTNGTIFLWETAPRTLARTLNYGGAPGSFVRTLTFSPDGQRLAVAVASENTPDAIYIFGLADGTIQTSIQGLSDTRPRRLAFSPDGGLLAVGLLPEQDSDRLRVYESATGALRFSGTDAVLGAWQGIIFSPDGRFVGALSEVDALFIYGADGSWSGLLPGHAGGGSSMAFSPDGSLLLTTTRAPSLGAYLWQTASIRQGQADFVRGVIAPDNNGILIGAWSPDSRMIVLADGSGGLLVWGVPVNG